MPFLFIPQHPGIDENQSGNTSSHYSAANIFDSYSKEELQSVHKFNASILAQKKDNKWPPSKYLMQIMNEQTEIEFRLDRMEQETRNEGDKPDNQEVGDEPEYNMLATKYKAMISPVRTSTSNGCRVASISMEEAARLERRAMEAQTPSKKRPEPPVIHNGLSEQEKHERILAFMTYQASDEDDEDESNDDDDDDETMELDEPARGGEYIDTDDLRQFIHVDPDIIPRGGRYFNGVGDC